MVKALLWLAACCMAMFGALTAFDRGPSLPLVSPGGGNLAAVPPAPSAPRVSIARPSNPTAPRHSGLLQAVTPAGLAEIAPPVRFRRDASAVIVFGHAGVIAAMCGAPNAAGVGPIACSGERNGIPVIAAPNPCALAGFDLYAAILCHELGHVNGWPKGHGD